MHAHTHRGVAPESYSFSLSLSLFVALIEPFCPSYGRQLTVNRHVLRVLCRVIASSRAQFARSAKADCGKTGRKKCREMTEGGQLPLPFSGAFDDREYRASLNLNASHGTCLVPGSTRASAWTSIGNLSLALKPSSL